MSARRRIVVTDLTRFQNREIVCTAGVDTKNGECIRPMPYLKSAECKRLNILPGAVLSGDFTPSTSRDGPHQEDYRHANLRFEGPCNSAEFKEALQTGLFSSVEEGFEISLEDNQKHIPLGHSVSRSIVTIAADPRDVQIVEDSFRPGKIKLNFADQSGRRHRYIGITDLGFYDYAQQHHSNRELYKLNEWIRDQDEVFLRVGLSRSYRSPNGREGCWLQANGIYTFPDHHPTIRSYA